MGPWGLLGSPLPSQGGGNCWQSWGMKADCQSLEMSLAHSATWPNARKMQAIAKAFLFMPARFPSLQDPGPQLEEGARFEARSPASRI